MSVNNKRVFYVKYLAHEIYADILRKRPDVRLDRLENESAEAISVPIRALRLTFASRRSARSASRIRFDKVSSMPSACSATECALPPD